MRTLALTLLVFVSLAPVAFAAPTDLGGGTSQTSNPTNLGGGSPNTTGSTQNENITLVNPLGSGTSLEGFLMNILKLVIRIGTIVIIFMIVFVGYKFVVAQGNESAIREARNMLMWTLVGALILLGAQAIALGVQATVRALSG